MASATITITLGKPKNRGYQKCSIPKDTRATAHRLAKAMAHKTGKFEAGIPIKGKGMHISTKPLVAAGVQSIVVSEGASEAELMSALEIIFTSGGQAANLISGLKGADLPGIKLENPSVSRPIAAAPKKSSLRSGNKLNINLAWKVGPNLSAMALCTALLLLPGGTLALPILGISLSLLGLTISLKSYFKNKQNRRADGIIYIDTARLIGDGNIQSLRQAIIDLGFGRGIPANLGYYFAATVPFFAAEFTGREALELAFKAAYKAISVQCKIVLDQPNFVLIEATIEDHLGKRPTIQVATFKKRLF